MVYNKHTWQENEDITAEKLNNIEMGVKNNDTKSNAVMGFKTFGYFVYGSVSVRADEIIAPIDGEGAYYEGGQIVAGAVLSGKIPVRETGLYMVTAMSAAQGYARYEAQMRLRTAGVTWANYPFTVTNTIGQTPDGWAIETIGATFLLKITNIAQDANIFLDFTNRQSDPTLRQLISYNRSVLTIQKVIDL